MPLLCIGGVCIPWSVLFPIVCWMLRPLYSVLPKPLQDWCDLLHAKIMAFIAWCTPAWMQPKKKEKKEKVAGGGSKSVKDADAATGEKGTPSEDTAQYHVEGEMTVLEEYEHLEVFLSEHTGPVLTYFTAKWCKPCQAIKPLINTAVDTHRHLRVVSVDIDDHDEACSAHSVFKVPTLIVFQDGKEVHRGSSEAVLEHASITKGQ